MEGSEDDAGTATNDSRRGSAREKDVQVEEGTPGRSGEPESSESKQRCETPAMSLEENFDGDSVPSPSAQYANTSTEDILCMIDELVDGPDVTRRLLAADNNRHSPQPVPDATVTTDNSVIQNSQPVESVSLEASVVDVRPFDAINSSIASTVKAEAPAVQVDGPDGKHFEVQACSSSEQSTEAEQPASSVLSGNENTCAPVNITSSSYIDSNTCQVTDRTVKCDTSSVNINNETVENVESTSSDNVLTEVNRSPLRRRLVRPSRPDTTVSSTVDSQPKDIWEPSTSENVTKVVSSSSDAVTSLQNDSFDRNVQDRSISKLNVCDAETSVSSPKKIRLIRNNPTQNLQTVSDSRDLQSDSGICQSTSSEAPKILLESSVNSYSTSISNSSNVHHYVSEVPSHQESKVMEIPPEPLSSDEKPQVFELSASTMAASDESAIQIDSDEINERKVPPIKLHLNIATSSKSEEFREEISDPDTTKQVPKLTIKFGNKSSDENRSNLSKLTIKPIRPDKKDNQVECNEQMPIVTKLNIKPVVKPADIDSTHRQSSSTDVSESEGSEVDDNTGKTEPINLNHKIGGIVPKVKIKLSKSDNDQKTSKLNTHIINSEQTEQETVPKVTIKLAKSVYDTSESVPAADPISPETVPKVTIKMGKPGTESEGIFYTEHNIPKLKIKGLQNKDQEEETISKIVVRKSNLDEGSYETVTKLTIKPVTKSEGQSVSPKLTIKPIKPPENINVDTSENLTISKLKSNPESLSPKENAHYPKITIKPVTKPDAESKQSKKSASKGVEESETIPVITKLNIKPVIKPPELENDSKLEDRMPVVSKLNIKPILKPKDLDTDICPEDVPKIAKLNIKPIKSPTDEQKDLNEKQSHASDSSIPIVTKINIKPILKPDVTANKSGHQSSDTSNSSDDNTDPLPVVTKLNIKPVVKPIIENDTDKLNQDENIPVITKLNIKPIIKPDEVGTSVSKDSIKISEHYNPENVPVVKKLNIKPVVRPNDNDTCTESLSKNPPLLMKINIKAMSDSSEHINSIGEHELTNNIDGIPGSKPQLKAVKFKNHLSNSEELETNVKKHAALSELNDVSIEALKSPNKLPNNFMPPCSKEDLHSNSDHELSTKTFDKDIENSQKECYDLQKNNISTESKVTSLVTECVESSHLKSNDALEYKDTNKQEMLEKAFQTTSTQGCTLLKQLLEDKSVKHFETKINASKNKVYCDNIMPNDIDKPQELIESKVIQASFNTLEDKPDLTRPLEINTSDKMSSSGQDSPRIILKINKTDQGTSSKIITEDVSSSDNSNTYIETSILEPSSTPDLPALHKAKTGNKKKLPNDEPSPAVVGKRLRSSGKTIQDPKTSSAFSKNIGKRNSPPDITPATQHKASEQLSMLEAKRFKIGQLISNKSLTITPVTSTTSVTSVTDPVTPKSPPLLKTEDLSPKSVSSTLIKTENCSKNGNSKLHKILSSLTAKQIQNIPHTDTNCTNKTKSLITDIEPTTTPIESSDLLETTNANHQQNNETINKSGNIPSVNSVTQEVAHDSLNMNVSTTNSVVTNIVAESPVPQTPQPKKRGRPRKIPLPEGQKLDIPVTPLPTPALEERPQRSLRLTRERPPVVPKTPRGRRGRGRGLKRTSPPLVPEPVVETANKIFIKNEEDFDPTSSRVKLPRMTEALDSCSTPLSSRRRSSVDDGSECDLKVKVVLEDVRRDMCSPETGRGGSGRGRARGRGRTPGRAKGRFRGGGGRGVVYMKETMGIYGRVCGSSTSTLELFEEQTCMMDDNATPAKPLTLMDEDSQSSVKSSTNESSSRMKKSKFVDLFDSNKIWLAADVKEYNWPLPDSGKGESQVLMIQEQVAMFLGVKSFKRRYPELKRRNVTGEERDYLLSKGIVTEALCDLGITAVDASEVLDIMLSDFPHKYEEYRTYQRQRQITEAAAPEPEPEVKIEPKVEPKPEIKPVDVKTDLPKVDLEKLKQEMRLQAIQSASEFNARLNASRSVACVDLQSNVIGVRRAPSAQAPQIRVAPALGYYPVALLPGQYQHTCRYYTPEELNYLPMSTVLSAPPLPPSPAPSSSSESESDADSTTDVSDNERSCDAKRKKLLKKRASTSEIPIAEEDQGSIELCKVCGLREEANRKYTSERFLQCGSCHAKLHPSCSELGPDTLRKVREYSWQCAECKVCCGCKLPADDDKMLFCDLCDRGFHIYCVGLQEVPQGRWHCVECAVCRSCGARSCSGPEGAAASLPPGPVAWHHQTRRGPGGHKLYSHSLCTPCASKSKMGQRQNTQSKTFQIEEKSKDADKKAYRIGRYCPLCDKSFIGPKGTMQLVICKLCDRQLHQECVKQTVSNLNVLDYTCAECRRGGITSRSAAAKAAPKGIATLFMAKRRFNKYAHRQYMKSRMAPESSDKIDDVSMDKVDDVSMDKVDDVSNDKVDDMSIDKVDEESVDKVEEHEPASDPLELAEEPPPEDEAASAVKALQMDFGD